MNKINTRQGKTRQFNSTQDKSKQIIKLLRCKECKALQIKMLSFCNCFNCNSKLEQINFIEVNENEIKTK